MPTTFVSKENFKAGDEWLTSGAGGTLSAITGLTPNTGPIGGAATLTVTGTGFTAGSTVIFDGDPRPTTFVSATSLTAPVAGLLGPARTVNVTVSTGGIFPFTITAIGEDPEADPAAHLPDHPEELTIAQIHAWVDNNPHLAADVLLHEQARGEHARSTLVTWLEGFIESHDGDDPE